VVVELPDLSLRIGRSSFCDFGRCPSPASLSPLKALSPGSRCPRRIAGSGGMIIFCSGTFGGFFLGEAIPAAICLFSFFLLYRLVKYIEKPMIHAIPITPPHTLPAISGVKGFALGGAPISSLLQKENEKQTHLVDAASNDEVAVNIRYVELGVHSTRMVYLNFDEKEE
jgi:hypothetical protein